VSTIKILFFSFIFLFGFGFSLNWASSEKFEIENLLKESKSSINLVELSKKLSGMFLADLEKYLNKTKDLLCELKEKCPDENEKIKNLELLLASLNKALQEKSSGGIKDKKFWCFVGGLLMSALLVWIFCYLMSEVIDDRATFYYDPSRKLKSVTHYTDVFLRKRAKYEYYD